MGLTPGRGLNRALSQSHGPSESWPDPGGAEIFWETQRAGICLKRAKQLGKLWADAGVACGQTWRRSELPGKSKTVILGRLQAGLRRQSLRVLQRTEWVWPVGVADFRRLKRIR